jgi:hypothetical protein
MALVCASKGKYIVFKFILFYFINVWLLLNCPSKCDRWRSSIWPPLLYTVWILRKRYNNPCTDLYRPWGIQEVEASKFRDNRHMKVVRLSAPAAFTPQEIFLVLISVIGWVDPHGHSAAGRIVNDIGNRTSDLPARRAVPQPTALPRVPNSS